MATLRKFSILADSNVKRHMNPTNCRDRPLMSGCQLIPCGKLAALAESLRSVRAETNVCIVSCLSNFLTDSDDAGSSATFRVEPVFLAVIEKLNSAAAEFPDRKFLISPPMYRLVPLWYRDSLPEILTKFSEVMKNRADNVHLLSSFPTPSYEGDGVHLTAYSGLEFVLHLFDSSRVLLDSLDAPVDQVCVQNTEASRLLEDRMVAIEQDHRRLNLAFEFKTAEDSEQLDYHANVGFQSWFVIAGLDVLPDLSPKEWQERAKADVKGWLSVLMGREYDIVYVVNNTSRKKDAKATYAVQLKSVPESKEIRDKFGSFFLGKGDTRPEVLKKISIRNRVTVATSARVLILKLFAKRYHDSNPGSKVQVTNYEPLPLLKLTPPPDASDRRVQTFNFVQAVKSLPANFTKAELDDLLPRLSPKLHGRLRSLFVVISDDMLRGRVGSLRSRSGTQGEPSSGTRGGPSSGTPPTSSGGHNSQRSRSGKRGPSPSSGGKSGKQKK